MSEEVVRRFVDTVNARDTDALVGLMTEDHWVIELGGRGVRGRDAAGSRWKALFEANKDYAITIESVVSSKEGFLVLGQVDGGTDDGSTAMICEAWVRDGQLSVWREEEDAPHVRRRLGLLEHEAVARAEASS